MSSAKRHGGEIGTDRALARKLLSAQFPQWAGLALEKAALAGAAFVLQPVPLYG
jgi:hypothetical protein